VSHADNLLRMARTSPVPRAHPERLCSRCGEPFTVMSSKGYDNEILCQTCRGKEGRNWGARLTKGPSIPEPGAISRVEKAAPDSASRRAAPLPESERAAIADEWAHVESETLRLAQTASKREGGSDERA
jgi:hypothetical protein